mmetsp:Transcript_25754/g.68109  ORF Transcript_25754/g.68109 Transcript_25754/m.68109 type:complete len:320 (+) Transcript_25754:118-1077(+)
MACSLDVHRGTPQGCAVLCRGGLDSRRESTALAGLGSFFRANPHAVPLAAGAAAGTIVEATLFPLDALKTRLQAGLGSLRVLRAAGGTRAIYRGVGLSSAGSIPASAVFFGTYESAKAQGHHVLIASVMGELVACSIRVPVDLMKQRMQTGLVLSFRDALRELRTMRSSTIFLSFRISVMRDATHSGLQYPLYEYLKMRMANHRGLGGRTDDLRVRDSATCGCAAGVASALVTTPFDVLRTRTNLGAANVEGTLGQASIITEARKLCASHGVGALFKGAGCRAAWMGLGGFVFLGSFELAKSGLTTATGPRYGDVVASR